MMEVLDYTEALHEGYMNDGRVHGSFYPASDICPFCHEKARTVFANGIIEYDPENRDSTQDVHHSVIAKSCRCGWWTVENMQTPDAHNLYAPESWLFAYRGVLRTFSLADSAIPMDTLRRTIAEHQEAIDHISPRKMEELVGAVMADFWPGAKCTLCGKSGDGGIDLLLIRGDKPFAIQVKHRQDVRRAESVHHVTHFIGALMLANVPNGIFVTTADHFSSSAERAVDTVLKRELVESFHLIDRSSFMEILEATSRHVEDVWRRCIPEVLLSGSNRLTPYSVCLRPPNQ
jgi:restriction system protein